MHKKVDMVRASEISILILNSEKEDKNSVYELIFQVLLDQWFKRKICNKNTGNVAVVILGPVHLLSTLAFHAAGCPAGFRM